MHAPGHPGIPPTWTSSAKDMVGCALGPARLWFTTGYGIVNEVYCPRVDTPQIRDLGFIVADGNGFWIEVKRMQNYRIVLPGPGIPAIDVIHTHARFELRLSIVPDPQREVLLIGIALDGDNGLRPYALLAPHLGGSGCDNLAEAGVHRGRKVLWAEQGPFGAALAAGSDDRPDAWGMTSAGYVGASDGWQDFARNGALTWQFDTAGPGNVALIGELPVRATLALGFGTSRESAATLAFSALAQPIDAIREAHVAAWREWHGGMRLPAQAAEASVAELSPALLAQVATSAMVLRVHQDKTYPGAMIASLSIPWGNSKDDTGGYHLVWPRDLVESAGGLLALGETGGAANILRYLIATQHADGRWSQNQWLGGKAYWQGEQLDETAFPVLLATALADLDALDGIDIRDMVHRALTWIAGRGPATEQDRWEEDAGINAFTLAVCISALVCGARYLAEPARRFALMLADYWNSRIEAWTTVRDSPLARECGVAAYYIRCAPAAVAAGAEGLKHVLPIKNCRVDPCLSAAEQVGTDFLQLVRFGLRHANDPMVVDTIEVIDHRLKVETPFGPAWHRYTGDGYGEHDDGGPFDGVGIGRAWPLLTGERGHFEVAAGRDALPYLEAMAAMTGPAGMIPEQVWDAAAIPERNLRPGKPSGSAMPLVWAHAEFIKLAVSRQLQRPFDRPEAVWQRYHGRRPVPDYALWMPRFPIDEIEPGQALHICLPEPARVHWGVDGWQEIADSATLDHGLGWHVAEIPGARLAAKKRVDFAIHWTESARWEGRDYAVRIGPPGQLPTSPS
ncbi:MAG TPA: glycoside hydrolase family 15 protein [Casimicrobiaceae bacterium]